MVVDTRAKVLYAAQEDVGVCGWASTSAGPARPWSTRVWAIPGADPAGPGEPAPGHGERLEGADGDHGVANAGPSTRPANATRARQRSRQAL
jgi:hypothetical protein